MTDTLAADVGARTGGLDRLFLKRQATFWARKLRPSWSRTEVRAEVVRIAHETHDTKTFWLRPNHLWKGHVAGQYVTIGCEINGVLTRRCYSLSSRPGQRLVAVTVKRVTGGLMSPWLHDRVKVGDRLVLSPAAGEFTIPLAVPARLLFMTAGSGITPAMAILRDLVARRALPDTAFVHHARTPLDRVFREELEALQHTHPQLRLHLCTDSGKGGPFTEDSFKAMVPDFGTRETYLCGPAPLMDRVAGLWEAGYDDSRLHAERFALPVPTATRTLRGTPAKARLTASGRLLTLNGAGTLLEQLELAGVSPAHGCRIGICHTCKCIKQAGSVENVLTGVVSDTPGETIQICISRPHGDVTLDL